jgi:hypothetical protein
VKHTNGGCCSRSVRRPESASLCTYSTLKDDIGSSAAARRAGK